MSVDLVSMSKKIAWSAITGSKIFDEWKARPEQKGAVKGIEDAGIDFTNMLYLYTLKNEKIGAGQSITMLLPLSSSAKWEAFIKKNFQGINIKDVGSRKEAAITEGFYAGWDSKVLIVDYAPKQNQYVAISDSLSGGTGQASAADEANLAADIARAFEVPGIKDGNLTGNKRFLALQKDGHDIAFWVNYEEMMNGYMGKEGTNLSALNFSNSLWKDAAVTAALDFDKGSLKAEMKNYMSQELKEISKEMGSGAADKEMVTKLATSNLDMVFALHLSTRGLKDLLEKTNTLGLANVALSSQGLTVDEILGAYTGDIGFNVSNFRVTSKEVPADTAFGMPVPAHTSTSTTADYVVVAKINKKENLDKLLQLALSNKVLEAQGGGLYKMANSGNDAPVLLIDAKYMVVAKTPEAAKAYVNGSGTAKMPAAILESLTSHPFGFYMDIQQMTATIDPATMAGSDMDAATITEAKKLLENFSVNGGEFKNDAFEWNMTLNFTNKDENSLLQILNFIMHASDAKKAGATAYR
ncbi:MAG: hypothetical protein JSS82_06380 [Bacteroidetes bacterium]|nr:hypothetical protein [Bacteroidota bacterium]